MVAGKASGRKGGKAQNGREFSVILGTRGHPPEERAPAKPAATREPEAGAAEKLPAKEWSLGNLQNRRQKLDLYLTSLEDAHRSARIPEYSYARLKRKYEYEISAIDKMLKGKPAQSPPASAPSRKAPLPPPPKAKEAAPGGRAAVAAEGAERLMLRVPVLKAQISRMKRQMSHYSRSLQELRAHEKSFGADLSDIHKSLSALKSEIEEGARTGLAAGGSASGQVATGVNRKLDDVSKRLSDMCSRLGGRIDQLSVIEEFETAGYFGELKKEIEQLRSQLSGCVRREELGVARGKAAAAPAGGTAAAARKAAKPKPAPEEGTVRISGLRQRVGEDVKVACSIEPLKKLAENDVLIFWYSIRDPSGEGIVTSYKEIKEKRGVVSGTVKLTRTGSLYILFKGMA